MADKKIVPVDEKKHISYNSTESKTGTVTKIILFFIVLIAVICICVVLLPTGIYFVTEIIDKEPPALTSKMEEIYSLQLEAAPYDTSNCVDWETVTMDDGGKTICVKGTVTESLYNPINNFLYLWGSDEKIPLFLTSQDHIFEGLIGKCIVTTGKIYEGYDEVYLYVGTDNLYRCDENLEIKPTATPNTGNYDSLPVEAPFDTTTCIKWNQIGFDDVGSVTCVTGIIETYSYNEEFDITYLALSKKEWAAFYITVPRINLQGLKAVSNFCIVAIGEIIEYEGIPILYAYPNQIFMCPD